MDNQPSAAKQVIGQITNHFVYLHYHAKNGQNKLPEVMPQLMTLSKQVNQMMEAGSDQPDFQSLKMNQEFLEKFINYFSHSFENLSALKENLIDQTKNDLSNMFIPNVFKQPSGPYQNGKGHNGKNHGRDLPKAPPPSSRLRMPEFDEMTLNQPERLDQVRYFEDPDETKHFEELQRKKSLPRLLAWASLIIVGIAALIFLFPSIQFPTAQRPTARIIEFVPAGANKIGQFYFDKGSAQLTAEQKQQIISHQKDLTNPKLKSIIVRGFADPLPYADNVRNWDLSYRRALEAMSFMHNTLQIPYDKFTLIPQSSYKSQEKEEANFWRERKVEIFLEK